MVALVTVRIRAVSFQMASVAVGSILVLALLVALLPYFGAGQYRFPKDFCMFDLHESTYAALFLVAWLLSGISLLLAVTLSLRPDGLWTRVAMGLAFVTFFTPPLLIDFIYLAGGTQPDTIYGALAII